jgi:hypothetical protein
VPSLVQDAPVVQPYRCGCAGGFDVPKRLLADSHGSIFGKPRGTPDPGLLYLAAQAGRHVAQLRFEYLPPRVPGSAASAARSGTKHVARDSAAANRYFRDPLEGEAGSTSRRSQ